MSRIPWRVLFVVLVILGSHHVFAQTPPPPPPKPGGKVFSAPIASPTPNWQEASSQEDNYRVELPGNPLTSSQQVESPLGKIPVRSLVVRHGLLTLNLLCANYPVSFDTPEAAQSSLNGVRDLTISQTNGKLISEDTISYGKFPGREWKAKTNQGIVRARNYIVYNRLYALMVLYPETADNQPVEAGVITRFFDSFKLLAEPAPPANVNSIAKLESLFEDPGLFDQLRVRPVGWREYTGEQTGFKLMLPGEPEVRSVALNSNDPSLTMQLFLARGDKLICMLLTQRLAMGADNAPIREILFRDLLNGLSRGVVAGGVVEMKMLSQADIQFQGYSGQEYNLRLDSPNSVLGRGAGRSFILGNTLFALIGLAIGADSDPSGVKKFLDSFTVPNLPPPPAETSNLFTSTTGNFSVALPSLRGEGTLPLDMPFGKTDMRFVVAETPAGSYAVAYAEFPEAYPPDPFFDALIESMSKAGNMTLLSQEPATFHGFPGRAIVMRLSTGQLSHERLYLINTRYYQLRAALPPGQTDTTGAKKFFDSFKLLKLPEEAAPPPPPMPEFRQDLIPAGAVKVSGGILQGALAKKKVEPAYPPIAKAAGANGPVNIQVAIAENGQLLDAVVLSGHPLLREAALSAARQWQFRAHTVNGKPVKAVGILTFQFTLK